MATDTTLVHITHEATGKIGGIGEVLQGLFTCDSYLSAVGRSIIVGPLFSRHASFQDRLGEGGQVLYSSLDGFSDCQYAEAFRQIEQQYKTPIVYGRRKFIDKQTGISSCPEVLLVDVSWADVGTVNRLKRRLYDEFGIHSDRYEQIWEYDQYVRLAPTAIAALRAMGAGACETVFVAHEFMGMPTVLAAMLEPGCDFKTVFYAHEVATIRRIVETHCGHDTMFYNVLRCASEKELYVGDIFGGQENYFKHVLVKAARYCDTIWAVGDNIADELRFLTPDFCTADIDIVYNGIPAYQIDISSKLSARAKLCQYCEHLLGFKPDLIFTHVTRLVPSKGLWRDLRVLEHLEGRLRSRGQTGVLLLLSTEVCQRRSTDIMNMEAGYNWPLAHREGWPDLSGGEADFYTAVQEFNTRSRNIKVIFINQFGFDRKSCGVRIAQDMEFMDIRRGSDVEFGQSIYEPFGIAQLESLTFGGICVVSNVCGCAAFLRRTVGREAGRNFVVADYTDLRCLEEASYDSDVNSLAGIDRSVRNKIEDIVSQRVASEIYSQLPSTEAERGVLLEGGFRIAGNMGWETVVRRYLLPSLERTLCKQRKSRLHLHIHC